MRKQGKAGHPYITHSERVAGCFHTPEDQAGIGTVHHQALFIADEHVQRLALVVGQRQGKGRVGFHADVPRRYPRTGQDARANPEILEGDNQTIHWIVGGQYQPHQCRQQQDRELPAAQYALGQRSIRRVGIQGTCLCLAMKPPLSIGDSI